MRILTEWCPYHDNHVRKFRQLSVGFIPHAEDIMDFLFKKNCLTLILDSCLRQFPEFGERARKRIRTYLKSCRRHKRARDHPDAAYSVAGTAASVGALPSPNRTMPSHLTSVVAEQILAQACENENQNAKRLRLGLEPISQPLPPPTANEGSNVSNSPTTFVQLSEAALSLQSTMLPTLCATNVSPSQTTNLFRPAFGPYQRSSNNGNSLPSVSTNQGTFISSF